MTARPLALLFPAALAGCATLPQGSPPPSLDQLLSFTSPALCDPGPSLSEFLGHLTQGDANEGFKAGRVVAPPALSGVFGRVRIKKADGYWLTSVRTTGTWLGLPVVALHQDHPEGGDPGGFQIEFGAPLPVVERRLKAAGFPARANVEVELGEPDGYAHLMTLEAVAGRPGRSLLRCGYS